MVLSKSAWYSKIYYFTQAWWAWSLGRTYEARRYEDGSISNADICTFMRALIVKLPIMIIAHISIYWFVFFTFFQLPIHYLGFSGWFTTILIIAGIIGLGYVMFFGEKQFRGWYNARPQKPIRTKPSFLDLCKTWVQAKHDKICVLMTFEDELDPDVGFGDKPSTEKPGVE